MTRKRPAIASVAATIGLAVSACSTLEFEDYCRYSDDHSLREADPRSLGLVLGVRPGRARENPFVVVRSLSETNPGASVTLLATAAPHPLPVSLDESRCAAVDWRTYALTVDEDEWRAFWADDRNSPFEVAVAFLDNYEPLQVSEFGAAIVDTAASYYLVSCGCYWK